MKRSATTFRPPKARKPWRLEELLGQDRIRYYSLGRWALVEALKACGGARGDDVLLPEFICRDLLASLKAAGCRPLFYPVNEDLTLGCGPGELPAARAIVAVNYFGFPQDLSPFEAYAARTGARVIEDNAHGLFSKDERGRWLGTRAPLGILSARKTMALPSGGALLVNDPALELPAQAPFIARSGLRYRLKRAFGRIAAVVGPVSALKGLEAFRRLRGLRAGNAFASPDAEEEIPFKPNPPLLLEGPIRVADPDAERERRRALYGLARELLSDLPATPVFSSLPEGVVPYAFAFRAARQDLPKIKKRLASKGLFCLPWPDLPLALAERAPERCRNVWVVHFLW